MVPLRVSPQVTASLTVVDNCALQMDVNNIINKREKYPDLIVFF